MADIVFALQSAVTVVDGARFRIQQDEAFFSTDPVVKAHPAMFDDVPASLRRRQAVDSAQAARQRELATQSDVEDASAEPGAKRSTRRPAKK